MNTFVCNQGRKSWNGTITMFKDYGTHYEFMIQSRSSIMVVFGKTSRGFFACMPDFNIGCHLVKLNDVFWDSEMLSSVLGKSDGITVASALFFLQDKLYYPEF